MSELERELFEQRLISIARGLDYPPTPDIAASVMARLRPSTRLDDGARAVVGGSPDGGRPLAAEHVVHRPPRVVATSRLTSYCPSSRAR